MIWIICTALFATLFLAAFFLLLAERADDRRIRRDLADLNESVNNRQLVTAIPSPGKRALILEINKTLCDKQTHAQALEARERSIRHAVENVSHDLRTPLTAVIGYIQLIESESDPDVRAKYFQIVKKRAQNLQEFISSYYELSRLEADEYSLQIEPVNLIALVVDAAASFYGEFEARGLEPRLDLECSRAVASADRAAIVRIADNLLHNALKYCKTFFRIHTAKRIEDDGTPMLAIEFQNDCEGLNPEEAGRIFDRFYVGERMRTGQNTGIGLAVVKSLAQAMDCQIDASVADNILTVTLRWKLLNAD